jgi:hypothetical protein
VLLACHQSKAAIVQLFDEPFLALDEVGLKYARDLVRASPDRACLIAVPAAIMEDSS